MSADNEPLGHDSIDSWLAFASGDPLVHSWDLAKAVGAAVVIEEDIAARVLERYMAFDTTERLRLLNTFEPIVAADAKNPLLID